MAGNTPKAKTRIQIDSQLNAAGWAVQNVSVLNLSACRGIAVRKLQSQSGSADYIQFFHGNALGIVKARTNAIDHTEAEIDQQIAHAQRLKQSTLSAVFRSIL